MSWKRNDQVIYLPTNEQALVTKVVNDELVYIRLLNDHAEIPAFTEDLSYIENTAKAPTRPSSMVVDIPAGIYLCFQYRMFGMSPEMIFPVFLVNGNKNEIGYDINFYTNADDLLQLKGRVKPGGIELIQQLPFPLLHSSPVYEIDWSYLHLTNQIFSKDIQFKASQFFNKYGDIPFLQASGTIYQLDESSTNKKSKDVQKSLKEYTKSQKKIDPPQKPDPSWEIQAKAKFDNVLDLHIENLRSTKEKMSNSEIFRIQLSAFDKFLDEAVRLKVRQVFVVHGVGKGKLRDEINSRLIQDHRVLTFKNEFHPNFGYGATEIWLY